MKVYLGADHRGFKLKEELKMWLLENKITGKDLGAFEYDPGDDYPIYAQKVARQVSQDIEKNLDSRGIVICGSGVGVDIVANKVNHIRSGLAVSSDFVSGEIAKKIVKVFLKTKFSKEEKKLEDFWKLRK